ncbi:unnamed protein product [Bathycoccus prasinos]
MLGLTSCSRVEACGICLDSECLDRFEEYLTHDEQVEFKHCLISSDSRTFEKYQVEVAKMIREREDVVQRKIEKEIGESKRLEEERRKKEEEEEAELQRLELEAQLKQEEEEKKRVEQQRERLAVLKLEQKEKISQQQREFTNKELLEIVNDTEEGRAILEREKLRIQAEMEKVESMESIPELQQIGMRVISFSNLKKPQDMKQVMLTLSIADSEGKVLESQDCCVIETLFEDGVYKTSCPETFFALKMKDIPKKSAFILELKHYKDKSDKFSTKCWSYIDSAAIFAKLLMEDNIVVFLPLAAKPMDPTRKNWVNYDWLTLRENYPKTLPKTMSGEVQVSFKYEFGKFMPPKKKAKTVKKPSLAYLAELEDDSSFIPAPGGFQGPRDGYKFQNGEAGVGYYRDELLEPATVSANTFLLKVFHEKASAEKLSHKKKAYLDAGLAIKECKHEITSGEDAMELKGVGKSSASLIDKALEERPVGVVEQFFDIVNSKGVREAYASLPKDAEITLNTDGVLLVNGEGRANYHASGCPFETEIDGVKYIVDGTADYDGFSNVFAGLDFSGTLTHLKNKKKYNFSFSYKVNQEDYEDVDCEGDFTKDDILSFAGEIVDNYEFAFYE